MIKELSEGLKNVSELITKFVSPRSLKIDLQAINQCVYINQNISMLVKFSNADVKDQLTNLYFKMIKANALPVFDFVSDPKIPSILQHERLFFSEHYSPMAGKPKAVCLKLRRGVLILQYKIKNTTKPTTMLTLSNEMISERASSTMMFSMRGLRSELSIVHNSKPTHYDLGNDSLLDYLLFRGQYVSSTYKNSKV
uniref:Uncharacterized protein n=1 Tax=Glossina austeni TaxID=7395 RepID=A0A1A9UM72_GLOAU